MLLATLALGVLAAAWSAGFFWTWSFAVMPGLDAAQAPAAIAVMRVTNAGIRTAGFAFVFFGPALLAVLATVVALATGRSGAAWAAGAAAVIYAGGVIGITMAFNLPLNDSLANASVTPETAVQIWRDYAAPWTLWNHLRTACATIALFALLAAGALTLRE